MAVELQKKFHCVIIFFSKTPEVNKQILTTTIDETTPNPYHQYYFLSANQNNTPEQRLLRIKRVVGGKKSSIEDFPYIVFLACSDNDFQISQARCGGSILSPKYVLTAAHCIQLKIDKSSNKCRVRAGSVFANSGGTLHYVKNYTIPKDYRSEDVIGYGSHDIAILELEEPIKFDRKTKMPIKMFEFGEKINHDEVAILSGWGQTTKDGPYPNELRSVRSKIVGKKQCLKYYYGGIHNDELCVFHPVRNEKHSACSGDSGGPLVIKDRLAGVMTRSFCSETKKPDIYTKVAHHRHWIDEVLCKKDYNTCLFKRWFHKSQKSNL